MTAILLIVMAAAFAFGSGILDPPSGSDGEG